MITDVVLTNGYTRNFMIWDGARWTSAGVGYNNPHFESFTDKNGTAVVKNPDFNDPKKFIKKEDNA